MSHLRLVYSATPMAPQREWRFTSRDLMALGQWMQRGEAHGYRRVLIEAGSDTDSPEEGGYVLIYSPDRDWASWGVAPCGGGFAIWHCGTGSDMGRYPSLLQALDSLPPVWSSQKARGPVRVMRSHESAASLEA